jgi:hypothetical protein
MHNKGFAIAGIPCFADTFVQCESSVLRMNINAEKPSRTQSPKPVAPMLFHHSYPTGSTTT